jgi:hypothetical protein
LNSARKTKQMRLVERSAFPEDDAEVDALLNMDNRNFRAKVVCFVAGAVIAGGAVGFASHLVGVGGQPRAMVLREPPLDTFSRRVFDEWNISPRVSQPRDDLSICQAASSRPAAADPPDCVWLGVFRRPVLPAILNVPSVSLDPPPPAADQSVAPDPPQSQK